MADHHIRPFLILTKQGQSAQLAACIPDDENAHHARPRRSTHPKDFGSIAIVRAARLLVLMLLKRSTSENSFEFLHANRADAARRTRRGGRGRGRGEEVVHLGCAAATGSPCGVFCWALLRRKRHALSRDGGETTRRRIKG